jgi:hypothetical protein
MLNNLARKEMKSNYPNIKNTRKTLRNICYFAMGEKCQICNYAKCRQALEIHHINSDEKEIEFGRKIVSWDKIYNELKKCILLCAVCHREVHYGYAEIPKDYFKFDETIANTFRSKNSLAAQKTNRPYKTKIQQWAEKRIARSLERDSRKNNILASGIDFSKFGWAEKLSKVIGIKAAPAVRWIKRNMIDFYQEKCYKQ